MARGRGLNIKKSVKTTVDVPSAEFNNIMKNCHIKRRVLIVAKVFTYKHRLRSAQATE